MTAAAPHRTAISLALALILAAALWASLLAMMRAAPGLRPPPIAAEAVSSEALRALRDQWEKRAPLLVARDDLPAAKEAPANARYQSDRNLVVERERIARRAETLPRPGAPGTSRNSVSRPATGPLAALGLGRLPRPLTEAPPAAAATTAAESVAAGGGAEQLLMDDSVTEEGDRNLLNARQSRFYSFYARINEAVGQIWVARIRALEREGALETERLRADTFRTAIGVTLDAQGDLVSAEVLESSRSATLDEAARGSWFRVSGFPNPPHDLLDSDGRVRLAWTFGYETGGNAPRLQWRRAQE